MFGVCLFCRILNYIILLGKYCFQVNHTYICNCITYFASFFLWYVLTFCTTSNMMSGLAAPTVFHTYTGKQKKSSGDQIPRVQPKKFAGRLWRPENFFVGVVAPGYKLLNFFYPWDTLRLLPGMFSEEIFPAVDTPGEIFQKFCKNFWFLAHFWQN